MKKLLLVLCLFPSISFAQNQLMTERVFKENYDSILNNTMPIKDGKIYYDTIISATGTKDDLFSRMKRWELNLFKVADNPFATEDKDEGFYSVLTRIKNGYKDYYFMRKKDSSSRTLQIDFKIRIYVKDNKARFIATDFATDNSFVDEKDLESVLMDEIVIMDTNNKKSKYQTIEFKNNQLASIADFFNVLNFKMKLIIDGFTKEIMSNGESSF